MKIYTLTFTEEQLRIINNCLLDAPTRFGMPLIQDINQQIQAQLAEQKTEE